MLTVAEALAKIPGRRDELNEIDNRLVQVIRHVEFVLGVLKPGVPSTIRYETPYRAYTLSYRRQQGKWCIMFGQEDDDTRDAPLTSVSRLGRAEAFTPDDEGQTPIERLIVEVAATLAQVTEGRSPQLDAANRISAALEASGFPNR